MRYTEIAKRLREAEAPLVFGFGGVTMEEQRLGMRIARAAGAYMLVSAGKSENALGAAVHTRGARGGRAG